MRILSASATSEEQIPLGTAAKMRILSASETAEIQISLGNRSENANFECQRDVGKADFAWEPQRECEFWMSEGPWKVENDHPKYTPKGARVTKTGFALLFNTNVKKKTT